MKHDKEAIRKEGKSRKSYGRSVNYGRWKALAEEGIGREGKSGHGALKRSHGCHFWCCRLGSEN